MTDLITLVPSEMSMRETYEIDVNETSIEIDIFHPEQVVLRSFRKTFDLGILCYKIRYMYDPAAREKSRVGRKSDKRKVDLGTLDMARSDIVKGTIRAVLSGNMRPQDARCVVRFIDYIDRKYGCPSLSQIDMVDAYINYTQYLFEQIGFSNIAQKSMNTRRHASTLQRCAAFVASVASGLELEQVKSSTFIIRLDRASVVQPGIKNKLDVQDKVFAVHLKIFNAIAEFVINQQPFPLVIEEDKALEMDKAIYFTKDTHSGNNFRATSSRQWPGFVFTEHGMLRWQEARELASKAGVALGPARGTDYQRYYEQFVDYKERNRARVRDNYRILANMAVKHFVHAIIADSCCNLSVLLSTQMQEVQLLKGIDKTRLLSIKGRAGYKKQTIEITNRFLPYYKKYICLREWMLGHNNTHVKLIIKFMKASMAIAPDALFNDCKISFFKSPFFPKNLPSIRFNEYRKGGSYHYLGITAGDIGYTAAVLGNSPETARKHYAYKHLEDSAAELYQFFEAFHKSCLVKATQTPVPVRVVENAPKINTGRCTCTSDGKPTLIEGFTADAPEPDCDAPVACFFCKHFGIHADEVDLTRLLSVREFITIQSQSKSRNMNEHYIKFLPIIARIDEIIEQFKLTQTNAEQVVQRALDNISSGNLDPYWAARINAMIDGGIL